jgi:hypothetical protein
MITMSSAMNTSFVFSARFKRLIIVALCCLPLWLGACSAARWGYGQGPTLAYWWLDGYVDFDEAQSLRVREDLDAWFEWHRRTQLPDYAGLLARARAEVLEPVTAAQLCRWNDGVAKQVDTALAQALPALSEWALTLTPAQLTHLERQYAKANAKTAEEQKLQRAAPERQSAALQRAQERAQNLLGKLNEPQRARLQRGIAEAPLDAALWLEERKARQQDILGVLRRVQSLATSKAPADAARAKSEAQAGLRAITVHWRQSPRESFRALQRQAATHNCQLAADVINLSTPTQRNHAAEKLKGWEEDVRVLIGG